MQNKLKTVAIIQARMQSTRLPGKVVAHLAGKPVLYRVVERANAAVEVDDVIVATSDEPADDVICDLCSRWQVNYYRGDQEDVLHRYKCAAQQANADVVVRLTADCPLLDPDVIDKVIRTFHDGDFDYVSNMLAYSYPNGLETEVFSYETLVEADKKAKWKSQREHVTSFITDHPELFRLGNVSHHQDHSHMRWTVDYPDDLEFIQAVYEGCGDSVFGMDEVLEYLNANPHLPKINAGHKRNEGYAKSLREDYLVECGEAQSSTP